MKTLGKYLAVAALVILSSAAQARQAELGVGQARAVTAKLLSFRYEQHVLGEFRDGKILGELEAILDREIPGGPHRVEYARFDVDTVTLRVKLAGSDKAINLVAAKEKTAAVAGAEKPVVSKSQGFAENLSMTVYDVTTVASAGQLQVTQVLHSIADTSSGEPFDGQVEVALPTQHFTLSVFARRIGAGYHYIDQVGAAATVPVATIGGVTVTTRVELAQGTQSDLEVVQGVATWKQESAFNSSVRIEASKTFGSSGITVSGGAKAIYVGASGLDQDPLLLAFLHVSKSFRDTQGREVANVSLQAVQQLGESKNGYSVSAVVSMPF